MYGHGGNAAQDEGVVGETQISAIIQRGAGLRSFRMAHLRTEKSGSGQEEVTAVLRGVAMMMLSLG